MGKNNEKQNGNKNPVIDLTKSFGPTLLDEGDILYDIVKEIKGKIKSENSQSSGSSMEMNADSIKNNIFISGPRGTGKTTILVTLLEELRNDKENKFTILEDIIDASVQKEGLLYYLFSFLNRESDGYTIEYKEKLFELISLFPSTFIAREGEEGDKYINLMERIQESDLMFRKKLHDFFKRFFNERPIVFFVDDIDLAEDILGIKKRLFEIFFFLSHKNIFVIASGDEENLKYRLISHTLKYYKDIWDSPSITTKENVHEKVIYTAISPFEKSFPSSNIFRLYNLSSNELKKIQIKTNGNGQKFVDFIEEIQKGFFESIYQSDWLGIFDNKSLRTISQILNQLNERVKENSSKKTILDYSLSWYAAKNTEMEFLLNWRNRAGIEYNEVKGEKPAFQLQIEHLVASMDEFITFLDFLAFYFSRNKEKIGGRYRIQRVNFYDVLFRSLDVSNGNILKLWIYENCIYLGGVGVFIPLMWIVEYLWQASSNIDQFVDLIRFFRGDLLAFAYRQGLEAFESRFLFLGADFGKEDKKDGAERTVEETLSRNLLLINISSVKRQFSRIKSKKFFKQQNNLLDILNKKVPFLSDWYEEKLKNAEALFFYYTTNSHFLSIYRMPFMIVSYLLHVFGEDGNNEGKGFDVKKIHLLELVNYDEESENGKDMVEKIEIKFGDDCKKPPDKYSFNLGLKLPDIIHDTLVVISRLFMYVRRGEYPYDMRLPQDKEEDSKAYDNKLKNILRNIYIPIVANLNIIRKLIDDKKVEANKKIIFRRRHMGVSGKPEELPENVRKFANYIKEAISVEEKEKERSLLYLLVGNCVVKKWLDLALFPEKGNNSSSLK